MSLTTPETAAAATISVPDLFGDITLLGIYSDPENTKALVRFRGGQTRMISTSEPRGDLTLIGTGDGWAVIQIDGEVRRLTVPGAS